MQESFTSILAREELLDHAKHPRNRGELAGANIVREESNPLCGDVVKVYVRLGRTKHEARSTKSETGDVFRISNFEFRISRMTFTGHGCVISQAAASLLTEAAAGKSFDEILHLELRDMEDMLGGPMSPSRVKCAMLALIALKGGIERDDSGEGRS